MEEKLINVYNQTTEGIIASKRNNKALLFMFLFCFISMLFFTGYIYFKSINLIHVIETNGNPLPTRLERKERLISASIQDFTIKVNSYINNINRMTLNENMARARFLVSNSDLQFIYNTYNTNRLYDKAKQQGIEYKSEFIEFLKLDITKKPYFVSYISKTTAYDGVNIVEEFYIQAEGYITEQTPQYEETIHGFYFSEYKQKFITSDD